MSHNGQACNAGSSPFRVGGWEKLCRNQEKLRCSSQNGKRDSCFVGEIQEDQAKKGRPKDWHKMS